MALSGIGAPRAVDSSTKQLRPRAPRYWLDLAAMYWLGSQRSVGRVINMSESGMLVESDGKPPLVGSLLRLRLLEKTGVLPHQVVAKVVRVESFDDGKYRSALRMTGLRISDFAMVRGYLRRCGTLCHA